MEWKDKKVLVFGTGISGIGSADLLEKVGALPILYDGNEKIKEEQSRSCQSDPHNYGQREQFLIGKIIAFDRNDKWRSTVFHCRSLCAGYPDTVLNIFA